MVCEQIRLAGIEPESIVDGPGIRYAVFTQGCPHHCPGCHNPQTHDPAGGSWVLISSLVAALSEDPLLAGLTLSGGEPFAQAAACAELAWRAHQLNKHVLCYSGWTLEQLEEKATQEPDVAALLSEIDTLIDGPYIEALRNLDLPFRGSSNQQIIELTQRK